MDRTSFQSLVTPQSVAVVGASSNLDKVGGRPLHYLLTQGFAGTVYAVNPRSKHVQGVQAYASLDALPEVPDVAVLCIGADQAAEQLQLCARLGIRHAILFASGFAEMGDEGRARQQRLAEICRAGGVRLLGPNTIGTADFTSGAVLSFATVFSGFPSQHGPVAILSQSGGIAACAYAMLRGAGWGVGCVATTGNEADVDSADLLEAFATRDGIRVVVLYLEEVKDPEKMSRALALVRAKGTPVLALRAGRSADGERSAALHTGSKGAATVAIDALFDRYDCRTVGDIDELVQSVPLYLGTSWTTAAPAQAPNVALVSNSGAGCVLAADAAASAHISFAKLSAPTRARLDQSLPSFSLNRNPIDLTAALLADSTLLGRVLADVLADDAVDAATLGLFATVGRTYDVERFARDARAVADARRKPLAFYSPHEQVRAVFAAHGHAVFYNAASALSALTGFWRHRAALQRRIASSSSTELNHG